MTDIVQARYVWEVYLDLGVQNHSSDFPVILVATHGLASKVCDLIDREEDGFECIKQFANDDLGLPFSVEFRKRLIEATATDVATSVSDAKDAVKTWQKNVIGDPEETENEGDTALGIQDEYHFSDG